AEEIRREVQGRRAFLKDLVRCDIQFSSLTEHGFDADMAGCELPMAQRAAALRWLEEEVTRYPPEFLRHCDLRAVRVVNDLRHGPDRVGGITSGSRWHGFDIYLDGAGDVLTSLGGWLD